MREDNSRKKRMPSYLKIILLILGLNAAIYVAMLIASAAGTSVEVRQTAIIVAVLSMFVVLVFGAVKALYPVMGGKSKKDAKDKISEYVVFGAAYGQAIGARGTRHMEARSSPGILGFTIDEENKYRENKKSDPRRR